MFCLNRKHNLKRHNVNNLDWPFTFKVNLKCSKPQPGINHKNNQQGDDHTNETLYQSLDDVGAYCSPHRL